MKKEILALIAAVIAPLLFFGVASCVEADTETPTKTITYTVQCGDTLWGIASEYMPAGTDKREYIYNIKKQNGLETSDIFPGMVLEIETEE